MIRILRSPPPATELTLLCQLLQLSAPALFTKLPDALPFQIIARLTPSQCDDPNRRLEELHRECTAWRPENEGGQWLKPVRNYLIPAGGPLETIIKLKEVRSFSHSF
jgi:hypothetical protein